MPVNALGLSSSEMDQVLELISKPQGLFLVCGPGGSGKTTTMHSLLHYLNQPDRKVCTVEDPIGVMQRGLRQVEVNEKNGLDFATATQALLRTDPDVIMVGEMRERETATVAIEAVLNGHLLISSLATKTAAEAIQRLRDMGVNSFDIADSLLGVLSQRSLKTLCNSCKKPYSPELKELALLAQEYCRDFLDGGNEVELDKRMVDRQIRDWEQRLMSQGEFTFYKAPGCKDCMDTGYRGSIGVHQLMVNTSKIKQLILNNSSENELREAGVRSSMRTHKQDGIEKILLGFTDYSQVRTL
jgi:type II secretory ATPase GspE/PulE/Tfp pilus assembly ATPase PilB-like protein